MYSYILIDSSYFANNCVVLNYINIYCFCQELMRLDASSQKTFLSPILAWSGNTMQCNPGMISVILESINRPSIYPELVFILWRARSASYSLSKTRRPPRLSHLRQGLALKNFHMSRNMIFFAIWAVLYLSISHQPSGVVMGWQSGQLLI